jgi:hypothetical protein
MKTNDSLREPGVPPGNETGSARFDQPQVLGKPEASVKDVHPFVPYVPPWDALEGCTF